MWKEAFLTLLECLSVCRPGTCFEKRNERLLNEIRTAYLSNTSPTLYRRANLLGFNTNCWQRVKRPFPSSERHKMAIYVFVVILSTFPTIAPLLSTYKPLEVIQLMKTLFWKPSSSPQSQNLASVAVSWASYNTEPSYVYIKQRVPSYFARLWSGWYAKLTGC
jgi:hypothetical protein